MDWVILRLVRLLPKKILSWAVIHVWAVATTEKYPGKEPDAVSWDMALKALS